MGKSSKSSKHSVRGQRDIRRCYQFYLYTLKNRVCFKWEIVVCEILWNIHSLTCSADLKGSLTGSQGICGYISVMTTLKKSRGVLQAKEKSLGNVAVEGGRGTAIK